MLRSGPASSLGCVAVRLVPPTRWRISTPRFVAWVMAGVLVLRASYFFGPLFPDEGGYFAVARDWHAGGPNVYGSYFVDRPPLLLAAYRLAVVTGWPLTVRVLATALCLAFVAAAAWAAYEAVGERGARWAALVAAAVAVTPLLTAQSADGELLAVPLVMLSMALTLSAVRRTGHAAFARAVGAGVAAGAAVMVKQNCADAIVLAVAWLLAALVQRRTTGRTAAAVAGGGVLGGGLVLAGVLVYLARVRVGLGTAWTAVFGFRSTALDVVADHSLHAPAVRATELLVLSVLTGLLPLAAVLLLHAARCRFRGPPLAWAVAATLLFDLVSVALGGSYWPHYLIELGPVLALAAGLWAPDSTGVRAVVTLVTCSALVTVTTMGMTGRGFHHGGHRMGEYLAASARPGDTATVLYGHADVLAVSGLHSPYEQLWTLPMRTLDPHLGMLRRVLTGPHAPTWVVAWGNLDPWHIDASDRVRLALALHYRRVADVCGHDVYLHDGVDRVLRPTPACSP